MGDAADAEELRQRLAEIREGLPGAQVHAGADAGAGHEQRDVLPRVIGARRRRIVAMVGRDDEEIVVAQLREELGQPHVEALEVARVALDVVAVAVLRVEVDQVREDEAAVDDLHLRLDLVHPIVVAGRVDSLRDPAAGKQILNLPDRHDGNRRRLDAIEQRLA